MPIDQIVTASIANGAVVPADLSTGGPSWDASGTLTFNGGAIRSGTAVASTSGTSIDFTSIPSWVKRVTVMFNGVSTNGTSAYQVQIGAGSIATTGYTSQATSSGTAGNSALSSTTGLLITPANGAATTQSGSMRIQNISGNVWVADSCGAGVDGAGSATSRTSGGSVTLSGTLDRIRITTVNGTDTFDAGSINILYEG